MTVVISQPMFFPWVGLLGQVALADRFVHYDDVAFSKGGFLNRVQIKGPAGPQWMTVPIRKPSLTQAICDVQVDPDPRWRHRHIKTLRQHLAGAPHLDDAVGLAEAVLLADHADLASLCIDGLERCAAYFGLGATFVRSSALGVDGAGSGRVLKLVQALGGDRYVTGHGARRYLDHELLEAGGVRTEYMAYERRPYPQNYGEFTPFVTCLDLVAHRGPAGRDHLCAETVPWRRFLKESAS